MPPVYGCFSTNTNFNLQERMLYACDGKSPLAKTVQNCLIKREYITSPHCPQRRPYGAFHHLRVVKTVNSVWKIKTTPEMYGTFGKICRHNKSNQTSVTTNIIY